MSIRNEALRLIGELPENCTWTDVLRAVIGGARSAVQWPVEEMREETATLRCDFDVVIERDVDGWYVGSVPALHGCHTQGSTLDELMVHVREAVEVCLDAAGFHPAPVQADARKMN